MTMQVTDPTAARGRALLRTVTAYAGAKNAALRAQNHPADALADLAERLGISLDQADTITQHVLQAVTGTLQTALLRRHVMCAMDSWRKTACTIDPESEHATNTVLREDKAKADEACFAAMSDLGIDPDTTLHLLDSLHTYACRSCQNSMV